MTKAVADLAHLAWATADNPRKESVERIFADMREGLGLGRQRDMQVLQRRYHGAKDLFRRGNVHGGGIGIVGGLAHIDMVIGMNRLF